MRTAQKASFLRAEILCESSSCRPGTGIDTVPGAHLSAAPVLQKGFGENRKFSRNAAIVITVGFCLIVFFFFAMGYKLGDAGWSHEFQLTEGNQMTQELVDAFENKRVHLLEEPSAELNALGKSI